MKKLFDLFKRNPSGKRVESLNNLPAPEHIPGGMNGHVVHGKGCPVSSHQETDMTQNTPATAGELRKQLYKTDSIPSDTRDALNLVIDELEKQQRTQAASKHIANQTVDEIREENSQLKIRMVKAAVKLGEQMGEAQLAREKAEDDRANEEFFKVAGYKISGGR